MILINDNINIDTIDNMSTSLNETSFPSVSEPLIQFYSFRGLVSLAESSPRSKVKLGLEIRGCVKSDTTLQNSDKASYPSSEAGDLPFAV